MDTRFRPLPVPDRHCLNCEHHKFVDKEIHCMHPQRPDDSRKVVKWFIGCPQFTKKDPA